MAALPQLAGHPMVTDGGLETDLIFNRGVNLSEFAAYPLLEHAAGRGLLADYFDGYASIAARAGAGLLLETPTWRANPDWGARLGHGADDLTRANVAAVHFVQALREGYAAGHDEGEVGPVLVCGVVGPRGDGYRSDDAPDPDEAADYHLAQVTALADAGADLVTAYTLTTAGEAIGVVRAGRQAGVPVAVSFTVEVDGRLPDGSTLAEAVAAVDAAAAPDYHLVNCAHPHHVLAALGSPSAAGGLVERIVGVRYNSSTRSHTELDEALDLDAGDLDVIASGHAAVRVHLPSLTIVGGCCGTDARHVARLWGVD